MVACFLVGCLSALQHPNPPDFCCAFQGTSEPIGSTPVELALPGDSQTKGLGSTGSETKCCAPAERCDTAQEPDTGRSVYTQNKRLQYTLDNHYIPITLREMGPLKQQ